MRTHYSNGDKITLPGGCDDCSPIRINGVLCHETGCRSAWKDAARPCFECGCQFYSSNRHERICAGCAEPDFDASDAFDDLL